MNNSKDTKQMQRNDSNTNIETARSTPFLIRTQNNEGYNAKKMENVRAGYTLPFEKQEDEKYLTEPVITEANQRANLRLETNTGANCCNDFEKKCIIF